MALLGDFFKVFSGEGFSSFSTGWNLAAVGAVVSGYVATIVTAVVVWEAFLCSCEEGSAVVIRLLIFGVGCFEVVDLLKEFCEGHLMIEAQKITDKCSDVRDVRHTSVVFQVEGEVVLRVETNDKASSGEAHAQLLIQKTLLKERKKRNQQQFVG